MKQPFMYLLLFIPIWVCAEDVKKPVYSSPVVGENREVVFKVYAPKASQVLVKGTFSKDPVSMIRDDLGLWSVEVGPLNPEIYHYQFDIDGVVLADNKNQSPYPWIEGKSELIVPGDKPLLHELTDVPHGVVHDHYFKSSTTDKITKLRVYTPPSYDATDDKEYPVVVLLDGFASKVGFWTDFGKVHFIADNLIAQKEMVESIIVIPDNSPVAANYFKFFTSQEEGNRWMSNNMDTFEKELFADVLPFVNSKYKAKNKP